VNPASASSFNDSGVTESGLASVVTSAPGSSPHIPTAARRILARSSAGSKVGVPPPKKTVLRGRAGSNEDSSAEAAKSSSEMAVLA